MMKLQLVILVFNRIRTNNYFNRVKVFSFLMLLLSLSACNEEGDVFTAAEQPSDLINDSVIEGPAETTDVEITELSLTEPVSIPLIAGQHIEVGTISVTNTETSIIVVYETTEGWDITETHVDVAVDYSGLHTNGSGNPQPGRFDQQTSHPQSVSSVTYVIDDLEWSAGMEIYLATHAVVVSQLGEETAWAGDLEFPGRNWATYFTYTTQEANVDPRGQLQFAQAIYETAELGRSRRNLVQIEVQRIDGAQGTISARYSIVGGTAIIDSDYVIESSSGVLEFLEGETSKIISIIILDDNEYEQYDSPYETIDLILEESCCLGTQQATQVQIFDDEELN